MKQYVVGVVGATGAVGAEMIKTLERRNFPVGTLVLLASERSLGKKVSFKGKEYDIVKLDKNNIPKLDIALFSAGGSISKEFAHLFTEKGAFVIDNSSAFRMDKDIPLVVPEVNSDVLTKNTKLIANPNCSTIQLVVALNPIHKKSKIKRVVVATYQAVSGAGAKGMEDLRVQSKAYVEGKAIPKGIKFINQIAFNCFPHIDVFMDNGYTKEEMKMTLETKKILRDESIQLSATCVRIPVYRSHSEAVWVETEKKLAPDEVKSLLKNAPGIVLADDPANNKYPMPVDAENQLDTYVGRIREDISCENGISMWVVSDNLLKGAAWNAVQIAEVLIERKLL